MALSLAAAGLMAGGLPIEGKLPASVRVTVLASMDANGPVAAEATGDRLAYVDHGLKILEVGSGLVRSVSKAVPTQLTWSTAGSVLIAAFELEGKSTIRIFNSKGGLTAETSIPGRISGLRARLDGAILVLAVELDVMKFGTRMAQVLHRWDGKGTPIAKVLNESTMMPGVAERLGATLPRFLGFDLSPLQDEILYYRLNSPPALDFNLRLMLYHFDSGKGRSLATLGLETGGACFSGAGDRILFGDGVKESQVLDPWGDEVLATLPVPGKRVSMSPSGHILLLDGRLYRNGQLVAGIPADSRGIFPRKGGMFFVAQGNHLYGISGLADEPSSPLGEAEAAKLRRLRKWLSEGLISAEDYRQKIDQVRP